MAGKGCRREPRRLSRRDAGAQDAWYYENPKSIDVYVEVIDSTGDFVRTINVRIPRAGLVDWLKRTAAK